MKDAFKTIAWEEQLGVQITNAYAGRGRPKLQAYPLIVYASPYCLYPDGAHASVKKNKLERQQEEGVPPVAAASTPASKRPRLAAAAEVAPATNCRVCLSEQATHMIVPCGHLCVSADCASRFNHGLNCLRKNLPVGLLKLYSIIWLYLL
ncbi:hypothetical protein J6590_077639 [Homalodisca vitripennis]|nr:hypothetical protein J6590_077639 [Homalodisca vitripennis]